jgi:hypothetical protein
MGVAVENGYGQLVVEMGVVGLLLCLVLGASIAIPTWKIVKQLRASPWFPICICHFLVHLYGFFPDGLQQP